MRNAVAAEVASLGAGQWGLLTAAQASRAGVSRMQLTRMVDAGLLDRVMHGVYATPGVQGDELLTLRAAWLTLDPGVTAEQRMTNLATAGVVSHASAAQLLGLGDLVADEHEFIVVHRRQSTRTGIRTRKGILEPGDVTIVDGLPVTTAPRTITDLLMIGHELEHVAAVVADALRRDPTSVQALEAAITPAARRHNARDGAELLVRLLDLAGMGVEDLERQVLDNSLGRELVRKAAGDQSLAVLVDSAGMAAALESIAQAVRAVTESPETRGALESMTEALRAVVNSSAMRELTTRAYDITRVLNSPGMQAAADAVARMADSPGMRAALSSAAQAQRLYDSPGMRAALNSAAQAQRLYDSPGMRAALNSAAQAQRLYDSPGMRAALNTPPVARALSEMAERAVEVTSRVDPDQSRALPSVAAAALSAALVQALDRDPAVDHEPRAMAPEIEEP